MTNSLKVAVCATLITGSVFSGFASEQPTSYLEQAQALASKAGSGLKLAGNAVLRAGADVSGWAQDKAIDLYSTASDKAGDAYSTASGKGSDAYQAISGQLAKAYGYASDKAVFALNWAGSKAPEPVTAFIANHPYLATTAIVAPLALLIGYRLGKARSAETKPVDKHNSSYKADQDR